MTATVHPTTDTYHVGAGRDCPDCNPVAYPLLPDDFQELRQDGDTIEMDDGRTVRLVIEGDPYTTINDYDCYGQVADVTTSRYADFPNERPDDFDGRACKLSLRDAQVWWQPPDDVRPGTIQHAQLRATVRNLLEDGFSTVTLEILDGADAYGQPIVTKIASVGAVDSAEPNYLLETVLDLASELDLVAPTYTTQTD